MHQALEQEHQRKRLFLVFQAHIGTAEFDRLPERFGKALGIVEQRTGVEPFDPAVLLEYLAADAQAVAAGNPLAFRVPEDQLLVVLVVVVDVDGVVAALARGAEGFLAPPSDFDHRNRNVGRIGQEALVTGRVEQLLARRPKPVELLDHRLFVARQGDGRHQFRRFGELFVRVVEFRLHRIDAAAQIAAQLVQFRVFRQLVRHDRLADTHRNGLALLVEQLIGQVEGAQHGVDAPHNVEPFGILRLEIDRYHRHVGIADKFDDRCRPGNIFHDVSLERTPVVGTLVGGYFPGGEQAQAAAGRQMGLGRADAGQAAAAGQRSLRERVDRNEGFLE